MENSKTIEKCIKKIKYLIDRYKEAKEWNRKQSGGSKKQSLFYDEIDAVLGCRDIVTLSHVSEAGTTSTVASSSPATSYRPAAQLQVISLEHWRKMQGSKTQTQQQQMAMKGQFIGAMTQFMSKNYEQIT